MQYRPGGDIFETDAQCIVNPVNCQVHKLFERHARAPRGKTAQQGLAGAFETRYPAIQDALIRACKAGKMKPGMVQVLGVNRATGARRKDGDLLIANLATKDYWADPSKLEWVDEGLRKLAGVVEDRGIRSIALPMLGAGFGKLPWEQVRDRVEAHFRPLSEKGVAVTVLGTGPDRAPRSAAPDLPDARDEAIYVAGIGARDTPDPVLGKMKNLGKALARDGMILRSGGADGADSAFEAGWDAGGGRKEIFLGWPGFEGRQADGKSVFVKDMSDDCREVEIAKAYYNRDWNRLGRGGKALMARNTNQLYGQEVGRSKMTDLVVCWTKGGAPVGGTGQALRIAEDKGIPILNLGDPRVKGLGIEDLAKTARGLLAGKDLESALPEKRVARGMER